MSSVLRRRNIGLIIVLVSCTALAGRFAHAQSEPAPEAAPPNGETRPAPSPEQVYQQPGQPLDERVNASKITENDPPPLPQRVVLPMPPVFELSTSVDQVPIDAELWRCAHEALRKGLVYLRAQQNERGAWMAGAEAAPTDQPQAASPVSLAVTALAVKAFAQADPKAMQDEDLQKALRIIVNSRKPDGTFDDSPLANYINSSVVSALAAFDDDEFRDLVATGAAALQQHQWDQTEGVRARQDWFGGAGYGNHGRPDLSNTQMMLDALYDAGLSPDEPAFQKALAFVSRTQNLNATNHSDWAGDDGGFIYTPANGGESMASEAAGEGRYGEKIAVNGQGGAPRSLRSYGSMTYAGFKSMLYAGLSPDDVRVRAAFDWIRNHWTFEENPGLGQMGLYYYYHTLARALRVAQQHEITNASGTTHNWREEMIAALLKRQRDDGSWVNEADRWMEGDPVLTTIYSVLALEEILKPVQADRAPEARSAG